MMSIEEMTYNYYSHWVNTDITKNIFPLWSTVNGNSASDRLAYSMGFEKLSDVLTIHL
jgi:hypothetical protein